MLVKDKASDLAECPLKWADKTKVINVFGLYFDQKFDSCLLHMNGLILNVLNFIIN